MYQSDSNIMSIPKESDELLEEINTLRRELHECRQKLHEYKQKCEKAELELSESNAAMETLAKNIDKNKFTAKVKIAERLNSEILPLLKEIKNEKRPEKTRILADCAIDKLIMFIPSPNNPYSILATLTPTEMRIAAMIKDGLKSEHIARMQSISMDTVKTHRSNIRKKLGLKNKQLNLASYLSSIFS